MIFCVFFLFEGKRMSDEVQEMIPEDVKEVKEGEEEEEAVEVDVDDAMAEEMGAGGEDAAAGGGAAGTKPAEDVFKGPRQKISAVQGTVFRARRFCVYVSFEREGKRQTATLNPGLAYVNGARLLLEVCRTDMEAQMLLPKGTKVTFDAVSARAISVKEVGGGGGGGEGGSGSAPPVSSTWEISLLWVGQQPMSNVTENFDKRIEWVRSSIYSSTVVTEPPKPPEIKDEEPWFIKSLSLPSEASGRGLPHPDDSEFVGDEGVVQALHRPTGGVIELEGSGEKVFFHRGRVFVDGLPLSAAGDLMDALPVGTKVKVDYVENAIADKEEGDVYFEDCPAKMVALLVYVGERPHIPELIFEEASKDRKEPNGKFYLARIVELDAPSAEGGAVEGGVAEIVQPAEYNIHVKNWLKNRLDTTGLDAIKKVRFHRSNLFHLGMHLGKTDLRYLFSSRAFGMGLLFCRLKALDAKEDAEVTHEMEVGWKASHLTTYLAASSGFIFWPVSKVDTLLYPSVQWAGGQKRQLNLKALAKEGWDLKAYLDVVEGRVPPITESCCGGALPESEKGSYDFGRVADLLQMGNNSGNRRGGSGGGGKDQAQSPNASVTCGLVAIETGAHAGLTAFFNRNDVTAFGFKLDKASLFGLLEQNEPVWVKVEASEKKEHQFKVKVTEMFVGWPHRPDQTVETMPAEDRHRFLLYLESKNLTVQKFLDMAKKPCVEQAFIPFRRDEMKGTVVQLERDSNPKMGATGGFIRVDKGPLKGKLVLFLRRNVWAMGYNMGKADLTHLFLHGQKVSLEAIPFPKDKLNKASSKQLVDSLGGECSHKATIVWTSKFRPAPVKSVFRNAAVDSWLAKRGLKWEDVSKLVEGKLEAVPQLLAVRNKSNMLKGVQDKRAFEAEKESADKKAGGDKKTGEKETPTKEAAAAAAAKAPVFRHGKDAERLCDIALSVTGPSDPRIRNLIKNDNQAQMAFHMQKALEMAVDAYKKNRRSPWGGSGGEGFGSYENRGGGMMQQQPQQQAWSAVGTQQQPMKVQMIGGGVGGVTMVAAAPSAGGNPWGQEVMHQQPQQWRPASGRNSTAAPLRSFSSQGGGGGGGGKWAGQKRQANGGAGGGGPGGGGGPKNKRQKKFQARN